MSSLFLHKNSMVSFFSYLPPGILISACYCVWNNAYFFFQVKMSFIHGNNSNWNGILFEHVNQFFLLKDLQLLSTSTEMLS